MYCRRIAQRWKTGRSALAKKARQRQLLASLGLGLLLSGCAEAESFIQTPSMLHPRGSGAAQIATSWWIMFGLGTVIYVLVMVYMLSAIVRRRRDDTDRDSGLGDGQRMIILGGILMPAVVIGVVYIASLGTMRALTQPLPEDALTVNIRGKQWWWEIQYPDLQIITANELVIPAGQQVQLLLTSEDVIHSLWIPQLQGKMDLNPGGTNSLWIQADDPGEYWGECAEFCGTQHAKMLFLVVALSPEDFAAWIEQQEQPAALPSDPVAQRGLEVFQEASCIYCHRIQGTDATGTLGPNLTHLASRRTLGAGIIPNTRGYLAGWISDPHSVKPGNKMPASNLSAQDLNALLTYLETLE